MLSNPHDMDGDLGHESGHESGPEDYDKNTNATASGESDVERAVQDLNLNEDTPRSVSVEIHVAKKKNPSLTSHSSHESVLNKNPRKSSKGTFRL